MQPVMWATVVLFALSIWITISHLRQDDKIEQSRWAWWKEFHQRTCRYPTPEEVDAWESQQASATV